MISSKSIQIKLTLAFLAIALLTALSIYVLARITSRTRLRQLIVEQQLVEIEAEVVNWYAFEGGWEGFDEYYYSLHPTREDWFPDPAAGSPPSPGEIGMRPPQIGVIDLNRTTLVETFATEPGEIFPEVHMNFALPVEVDGSIVAYVIRDDETGVSLVAEEQIYLRNTNFTLAIASAGGIGLALLMGMGLARLLVRPIQELTIATEAMATGDLKQQVPVRSEDELGRLAQSFNQMSADLAEATRQRRQMTADIAHDLGTPLQIVSGYVESMTDGTLAPTAQRLSLISAEIEHLRRLIEDLDLLSQTDTQTLRLQMQPIDPVPFLEQVVLSFSPIAGAEGVELTTDIPPSLPVINGDQERLMQVMGNLLSNALRYTANGEQIVVSGQREKDQVILRVKDHGAGIAAEDLPFIFERFYRADTSRTEGGKMGLGLAISKALVEAMGGTISADSSGLGHGATLTVALPVMG